MAKAKIKNTSHINDTDQGIKMANKPANAAQKKWMSDIAEWAQENLHKLYGSKYYDTCPQIHHVMGRSAKHNKVSIGHWFVIPVPFELHDVSSNHHFNVTHCKNNFTNQFGTQRSLFMKMYNMMYDQGYDLSVVPHDVTLAIKDTRA